MSRPRGHGGLRHISDILRDITEAEQDPEPPRIPPHPFNRRFNASRQHRDDSTGWRCGGVS